MSSARWQPIVKTLFFYLLLPALLYLLVFHIYTAPLLCNFSTHLFCDLGDGLQNVWNLWWVNKAVTELHQSPMYTTYLYYPHGISLYYHTLSPYNSFAGILLQFFMSLIQSFNCLVVSSYVLGGLTAFLLAFHLTRSYWGSLLAGFIFTFSSYHFAHGAGHLNLITIQWLPLFILLFFRFLHRPSVLAGIATGFVLFLNLISDYYYFLYCILIGIALLIWYCWNRRSLAFLRMKSYIIGFLSLILASLVLIGPLAFNLLRRIHLDQPQGGHLPERWSLDALALFIPGGHWRFSSLTAWYWSGHLDINEGSVFLGLSLTGLLIYTWIKRKTIALPSVYFWFSMMLGFAILALGPVFHFFWKPVSFLPMPYRLLEILFPPVTLSGVPIRMVVMVTLAASVLAAAGFESCLKSKSRSKWLFIPLFLGVLFIEYLPNGLPYNRPFIDDYVYKLAELDDPSPVIIKPYLPPTLALFHQTIHQQPMSSGYTSRTTEFIRSKESELENLLREKKLRQIRDQWGFKILIAGRHYTIPVECEPTRFHFNENTVCLYDLDDLEDDEEVTIQTEKSSGKPAAEKAGQ